MWSATRPGVQDDTKVKLTVRCGVGSGNGKNHVTQSGPSRGTSAVQPWGPRVLMGIKPPGHVAGDPFPSQEGGAAKGHAVALKSISKVISPFHV